MHMNFCFFFFFFSSGFGAVISFLHLSLVLSRRAKQDLWRSRFPHTTPTTSTKCYHPRTASFKTKNPYDNQNTPKSPIYPPLRRSFDFSFLGTIWPCFLPGVYPPQRHSGGVIINFCYIQSTLKKLLTSQGV